MEGETIHLFAYDGVDRVRGGDPYAVCLELSHGDAQRVDAERNRQGKLKRHEIGPWVDVLDQASGELWRIASAPCGLGCHCASVAVKVELTI